MIVVICLISNIVKLNTREEFDTKTRKGCEEKLRELIKTMKAKGAVNKSKQA